MINLTVNTDEENFYFINVVCYIERKFVTRIIGRYPALPSEMFTTLLEPEHPPTAIGQGACRDYPAIEYEDGWWGGTAVITAVAGATPSLYLALVFNGVFPKTAVTSHLVRVVLTLPEKNQTIIDQVYSYLFLYKT